MAFAPCNADHASGQIGAVLSLANSYRSERVLMSILLIDLGVIGKCEPATFQTCLPAFSRLWHCLCSLRNRIPAEAPLP